MAHAHSNLALGAFALLATACTELGTSTPNDNGSSSAVDEPSYVSLTPEARLQRASMVLRGHRPSLSDYERLVDDPQAYAVLVDEYLDSPAFPQMMAQYFSEWMELDQTPDFYPAGFPALGPLSGLGTHELNRSVIAAPGRLAAYIVENDRPWSEIVTANYTLADHTVATVWGLPYDDSAGGWQRTHYTDGRPDAGVLSDGWVFTRMPSTENNRQRERASLIANSLLCHDYPGRPVEIPADLDLTSEAALADAIANNPVCVGCHHTLDPLASFFAVHEHLRLPEWTTAYPVEQYKPEGAAGYQAPSFYGQPAADLAELGQLIAADPRFSMCMIRRVYSELTHQRLTDIPHWELARYLEVFDASDLDIKALARAIVTDSSFAALRVEHPGKRPEVDVGLLEATPHQLERTFFELTGYRWQAEVPFDLGGGVVGEVPLMLDYGWGYRTLAGAPNNFDTTEHLRTPTPTTVLVLRNLAERAARAAFAADAEGAGYLLKDAASFEGDPAAVRATMVSLHLRLFGARVDPSDPSVEASVALYFALLDESSDPYRAWELTLAALLQDPRMLVF